MVILFSYYVLMLLQSLPKPQYLRCNKYVLFVEYFFRNLRPKQGKIKMDRNFLRTSFPGLW